MKPGALSTPPIARRTNGITSSSKAEIAAGWRARQAHARYRSTVRRPANASTVDGLSGKRSQ